MMHLIRLLLLSVLTGYPASLLASDIPPRQMVVSWETSQFETSMPDPFGKVQLLVARDSKGETSVSFTFNERSLQLILPEGVRLTAFQKPEIVYDYPSDGGAGPSISIFIEYGPLVEIKPNDDVGLSRSASDWDRDIVVFKITSEGSVSSRLHLASALDATK